MAHVTLMTGPERRRRWSSDERREILMAAFSPGSIVADVSRRYEVSTSLIYKWRRDLLSGSVRTKAPQAGTCRSHGSAQDLW